MVLTSIGGRDIRFQGRAAGGPERQPGGGAPTGRDLQYFLDADKLVQEGDRREKLLQVIERLEADVIGLQETRLKQLGISQ